ncbi:hypothetical protein K438DRAFT_1860834, partial [Mycena galopus ATCC 62051]
MGLSIESDDIQLPRMLEKLAQCTVTLQKIDSCLRAQRELGTLKRLFKQSELTAQLQSCEIELKEALHSFTVDQAVKIGSALVRFNIDAERRHEELLELISSSNGSFATLSIGRSSLNTSSSSFSLLPPSPEIFHGRDSELEHVINSLVIGSARVAILGPGGMGKTALAVAAMHDTKVVDKYPTRHFIACDAANADSLVTIIARSLGLEEFGGSARHLIHRLSHGASRLILLDNFETPWEPEDSRARVEEFLSLLTSVQHVALLITMRGAERPHKIRWTHPFLPVLSPLTPEAANKTFVEIADENHDAWEI